MANKPNTEEKTLCGILNVNKPADWTSFDVVTKLRGVLHMRKLGHAGTLDPMATGVLPVFVGKAAKACDIIPDNKKAYRAGFRLGIETDTEDISGKVTSQSDKAVSKEDLTAALSRFVGVTMQTPPMYSAVKVNGKKLYEYAREGKVIDRPAREIQVDEITLLNYDEEKREGNIFVACRKGTYIRTIISDMGKLLGCGGVMTSLERTYSGGCDISNSLTIEEIGEACENGSITEIITPLDKAFAEYPKVSLNERSTALYKNGVKLYLRQVKGDVTPDTLYRVYGGDSEFLGIGKQDNDKFISVKNFFGGMGG